MSGGGFPQPFGKFVLTSLLARGGMSHVFLAKAEGVYGFRRLVVVKRMLPALSEDPSFVERFLGEARLGSVLQHRNIAQVFDSGQVDGHLFLAMEFVDGLDLGVMRARLRHDGARLPLPLALYVVRELCRGLDYAHRQRDAGGMPLGIVHRDVSPSNVLISRDGAVKLCDFGVAIALCDAPTIATSAAGKFSHLSPEQALGEPVDWRSDVFSAGIILWELLSSRRLYRAETEMGTLELAKKADVPRLELVGVPGTERLQPILRKALSADPSARHQTARDLRAALDGYAKEHDLDAVAEDLAAFLERACPAELRRRGLRRDGLATDPSESTPATPTSPDVPQIGRDRAQAAQGPSEAEAPAPGRAIPKRPPSRAFVPEKPLETVTVPDEFPEVVHSPVVEQELIVSKPVRLERPEIQGRPAPPPPLPAPRRTAASDDKLIEHLEAQALLGRAGVDQALAAAERDRSSLARALLGEHLLGESELCHALSSVHGVPTVDLASWTLPGSLASLVPLSLAQAKTIVPFRQEKAHGRSVLCVAMSEPDARAALVEIEAHSGVRCKAFFARPSAITAAIDRLYLGMERPVPVLYPKGLPEPR
ncbi:MAG: protein kinase [Deltaproteobacteria bacterium]|nr:protein kinase [Deltaproteobacteria bacterium]